MTSRARRGKVVVTVFVAAAAFGFSPGLAEAQWGMGGMGMGWGFGGFSQVEKPESFLYSKALVDAGRGAQLPSRNVYANNPNSYINHIRDNGFVDRYSVARREPSHYRYSPRMATPTALTVAQQTPLLPLASFYNGENQFVWPADSPTAGELKQKRSIFDQASQAVLTETKKSGVASIAAVTDARQKLLDYGRPALQFVRTHETPRIADTFHLFLLSTYESLAQAVNPPATAAVTAPPPSPAS
ncbi:MAG: hypothetical protein ACHRXM_26095 [Isosphaerales bacterium]